MFKTFMLAGLFFLFKLIVLVSSIFVIFSANPVHSVLFLVLVFINSAFLLMFLEADFMALILIVVYVGAIAVLFLFICMMLSIRVEQEKISLVAYLPVSSLFGLLLIIELSLAVFGVFNSMPLLNFDFINFFFEVSNIRVIGDLLYTYYFFYFILAGLGLLLAMLGAIYLTLHHRDDVKRQVVYVQVTREYVLEKFR